MDENGKKELNGAALILLGSPLRDTVDAGRWMLGWMLDAAQTTEARQSRWRLMPAETQNIKSTRHHDNRPSLATLMRLGFARTLGRSGP